MNGLGNRERKLFLGIAQGKVTYRAGRDAEVQTFDYVEGIIKGITRRDATINDKDIKFYEIAIQNGSNNFVLSVPMDGSVARGIILSLASIQNFGGLVVRISPWIKETFTNVSVYANGEKVNWAIDPSQLPPLKKVTVGRKEFIDDTDRVAFVEGLVDEINARIASAPAGSAAPVEGAAPVYDDGLSNGEEAPFPGDDQ